MIQYIVSQGGLAAFAIWMLVQSYKDKETLIKANKDDAERYALINREDKILLLAALDKGTENFATLNAKIDSFGENLNVTSKRQEAWQNESRSGTTKSAAAATSP